MAVFVVVAEAGSFSEAARRLGISPSAVSQSVRSLEERLGTPLFSRSTRSMRLTDVGEDYLRVVAPALSQLRGAAEEASGRGGRPRGPLRLTMPRAPFGLLMSDALVAFQDAYPHVELEIAVEARLVDIVKEGYDAGLRYGNALDKDMVAVLLAPTSEAILIASPTYFSVRKLPINPGDLLDHRAIVCRSQDTGLIIPWSLSCSGETVQINVPSASIVHDLASQIDLAIRGLGIACAPAAMVSDLIDAGELLRVLPAWSCRIEPLYLYFPNRRHQSAALRAFIAFLKRRRHVPQPTESFKAASEHEPSTYFSLRRGRASSDVMLAHVGTSGGTP